MDDQLKTEDMVSFLDTLAHDRDPRETVEIFSKWAARYDDDIARYGNETPQVLEQVLQDIGLAKGSRIIDIGAGTGSMGKKLQSLGYSNVDCMDGSADMMDVAKKQGIYNQYHVALICREDPLPLADATYDAVVLCCAIYPGQINPNALGRIARVVRPGGHLVIINGEGVRGDGSSTFIGHTQLQLLVDAGMFENVKGYPKNVDQYRTADVYATYAMKRLL